MSGIWLSDASNFQPQNDLVHAGLELAGQSERDGFAAGKGVGRIRRWAVVVGCAVALLIVGVWWFGPGTDDLQREFVLQPEILGPVRAAVETVSMWGPFVLPGGERAVGEASPVYRSAFVELNDSLESSLDHLYQSFQKGTSSPETASWLIGGYIATGQIDAARDLVRHPRIVDTTDSRIAVLTALIAYMDEDLQQSELILRDVYSARPGDPIAAINLAVVLRELGKPTEAIAILRDINRNHPGTPMAARALSILEDFDNE